MIGFKSERQFYTYFLRKQLIKTKILQTNIKTADFAISHIDTAEPNAQVYVTNLNYTGQPFTVISTKYYLTIKLYNLYPTTITPITMTTVFLPVISRSEDL